MKKLTSTFEFSLNYFDNGDNIKNAKVILTVNYESKSFSVTPGCGKRGQGFVFENNPTEINKWKAVVKCIDDAIEFAKIELDLVLTMDGNTPY